MSEIYNTLAEGYEKLAAGFRALASQETAPAEQPEAPAETPQSEAKPPKKGRKKLTDVEIRAVMSAKSDAGKTQELKALLLKYGASKLSNLSPDSYESFLAEVEAL